MEELRTWPHPYPIVTEVSRQGLIKIEFSKDVLLPTDLLETYIDIKIKQDFLRISLSETQYSPEIIGQPYFDKAAFLNQDDDTQEV